MHILAIAGSLRAASTNRAVLDAAASCAPAGVTVDIWAGLGALPHFNPDVEDAGIPEPVADLRRRVGAADALLFAVPEYAHGMPGSLKNAVDWLVGSLEFPAKPVALINASPRAFHAQAQLREVLSTMAARIVGEACIALPVLGHHTNAAAIAADPALRRTLIAAMESLQRVAAQSSDR